MIERLKSVVATGTKTNEPGWCLFFRGMLFNALQSPSGPGVHWQGHVGVAEDACCSDLMEFSLPAPLYKDTEAIWLILLWLLAWCWKTPKRISSLNWCWPLQLQNAVLSFYPTSGSRTNLGCFANFNQPMLLWPFNLNMMWGREEREGTKLFCPCS